MAGYWIRLKIHPEHPKVLRLHLLTGVSIEEVFCCCVRWFRWVDENAAIAATGLTAKLIDRVVQWPTPQSGSGRCTSLAEAMQDHAVTWLSKDAGGLLHVVDLEKNFGKSARQRSLACERQQTKRIKAAPANAPASAGGSAAEEPQPLVDCHAPTVTSSVTPSPEVSRSQRDKSVTDARDTSRKTSRGLSRGGRDKSVTGALQKRDLEEKRREERQNRPATSSPSSSPGINPGPNSSSTERAAAQAAVRSWSDPGTTAKPSPEEPGKAKEIQSENGADLTTAGPGEGGTDDSQANPGEGDAKHEPPAVIGSIGISQVPRQARFFEAMRVLHAVEIAKANRSAATAMLGAIDNAKPGGVDALAFITRVLERAEKQCIIGEQLKGYVYNALSDEAGQIAELKKSAAAGGGSL